MIEVAEGARTKSYGEGYQPTLVDRFGVWLSARQIHRYVPDFRGKRIGDFGCGYHAAFARTILDAVDAAFLADVSIATDLRNHPKSEGSPDRSRGTVRDRVTIARCDSVHLVLEHLWEPARAMRNSIAS